MHGFLAQCVRTAPLLVLRAAFFVCLHSSVVRDVKNNAQDVVEVSIDDGVTRRDVVVRSFYTQSYRRREFSISILQVDKIQNPLRTVLLKHEIDMLKSVHSKKYQYGARLMIAASLSSSILGAVSIQSMLEPVAKERFLKESFLLSVFDRRHRLSCILKLVTSDRPSTEWTS